MKLALLDKSTLAQVVNSPTLMNLKFHHRIQNSPALIHFLSQIHPVHILTSYSFKSSFNIIIPNNRNRKLTS
jgi:hypothetical protein